jgi:hypothetical protein
MTEDEKNLDLLAIFHYVVGGFTAFFACFPLLHVIFGLIMLLADFGTSTPPPPVLGWVFVILGGLFVLCGWALAVAILVAGRKLQKRKSRTYCLVVGGLECLLMPLGTVLGVFTLIVLTKESVKALFGGTAPAPVPPPAPRP